MKLRRVLTQNGPQIEALKADGSSWVALSLINTLSSIANQFDTKQDLATSLLGVLELGATGWHILSEKIEQISIVDDISSTLMIPFQPLSFRDFLLFEKHFIDASRGFVKRFLPKKYNIVKLYESITKRPFPKLMPPAIWYQQPLYYMGNHLNFVTSGSTICPPQYTHALDYELELGAIIAKPLFDATPLQAEAAIGGYVVLNDWSARDVQMAEMRSGFGPQKSKHFINGISPIVVTADEVNTHINDLQASVSMNGQKVVNCNTRGMQYSLAEAIAYASKGERLHSGELFGSGTLPGGSSMENGFWLQDGDELCLEINTISTLVNQIAIHP